MYAYVIYAYMRIYIYIYMYVYVYVGRNQRAVSAGPSKGAGKLLKT